MKWIEIIELRTADNTLDQLKTHLHELMNQVRKESDEHAIKVYTRMMVENDYSIHLFHDSDYAGDRGSLLGLRLVSALKPYGLVNHTIWIERYKATTTYLQERKNR